MEEKGVKPVGIIDDDYLRWVKEISSRYKMGQIKAAVKVNQEMLRFYWELGRDIVERNAENKYGSKFYKTLSKDLKSILGNVSGLSETTLRYTKYFYCTYFPVCQPHKIYPQVVDKLKKRLLSIPWGHHRFIIDKCLDNPQKALFYVQKTLENGWSRNTLLNYLDANLYERSQNTLTNFKRTLPEVSSDLALEASNQPIGISEYELAKLYPERVEGTIPSIDEIKSKLK